MATDITNWREPDHNIWGFQNVCKIIPTETVQKSSETSALARNMHTFDTFKLWVSVTGENVDLATFLARTETDGLVVLKDGAIVYEHYGRTNTKTSIHATFSISKSVTGLVCGILARQGKLETDGLISAYVPEVKGSAYEGVTIRQLLDMRAGITHNHASPSYRSATGLYPLQPNEKPTICTITSRQSNLRPLLRLMGLTGRLSTTSQPTPTLQVWSLNEPRARHSLRCLARRFGS